MRYESFLYPGVKPQRPSRARRIALKPAQRWRQPPTAERATRRRRRLRAAVQAAGIWSGERADASGAGERRSGHGTAAKREKDYGNSARCEAGPCNQRPRPKSNRLAGVAGSLAHRRRTRRPNESGAVRSQASGGPAAAKRPRFRPVPPRGMPRQSPLQPTWPGLPPPPGRPGRWLAK
jgi:hypothetical protein